MVSTADVEPAKPVTALMSARMAVATVVVVEAPGTVYVIGVCTPSGVMSVIA